MKIRIYTDASALGGCEDEEFAEYSIRLMGCLVRGKLVLLLSNLHGAGVDRSPDRGA